MLNRLIPLVRRLRDLHPPTYHLILRLGKRYLGNRLGIYPRMLGDEIGAVTEVLRGSGWNMAYGKGLAHERLEKEFAEFVGVPHAVAVTSGGVALQMSIRALGLLPGDEVIHQVDTCSATAMAAMNAGTIPIFADVSPETFMLDEDSVRSWSNHRTKALILTHTWGNPEAVRRFRSLADKKGWVLIEDACQALGAIADGRAAGSWGDTGIFSFGCLKPVQAGEGGMIVTQDEALARELRSMRHWGDRTIDFGVRDVTQLCWNGRMSELVAAVAREQIRGYPSQIRRLRESVTDLCRFLEDVPELVPKFGSGGSPSDAACTQLVLEINESASRKTKQEIWKGLAGRGISLWHANFELIPSLSFFSTASWKKWVRTDDMDFVARNYGARFVNADVVYQQSGIGLSKINFMSTQNLKHLKRCIKEVFVDDRR